MSKRKDSIRGKWMANGDIRFYRNDKRKGGVPELVCCATHNVMQTIICGNINNVIIDYEI